jgi:hypothetical protein
LEVEIWSEELIEAGTLAIQPSWKRKRGRADLIPVDLSKPKCLVNLKDNANPEQKHAVYTHGLTAGAGEYPATR